MVKRVSEKFKVYENVFDEKTLVSLNILRRQRYFDELKHIIKPGKEAVVYKAKKGSNDLAIKIYMITSSNFKKIYHYIERDIRFRGLKGNKRKVILAWTQKEARNLKLLYKAGVNVPFVYKFYQNLIIMDYIEGETLNNTYLNSPERFFSFLKEQIRLFLKAKLIHCDLSAYNIIVESTTQMPYIIDVGQSVLFKNEDDFNENRDFLERDIKNVFGYFSKNYGIEGDYFKFIEELFEELF